MDDETRLMEKMRMGREREREREKTVSSVLVVVVKPSTDHLECSPPLNCDQKKTINAYVRVCVWLRMFNKMASISLCVLCGSIGTTIYA